MDELNTKGIVHRAGEKGNTEIRKLTRSELKELVEIAAMPMSEGDKKKINEFMENHKTVIY